MAQRIIGSIAALSIIILIAITIMLLGNALPFFGNYSIADFLTGTHWHPDEDIYGLIPLLSGTLLVTGIAMLFALPLGIATAVYLFGIAPFSVRETIKPIMEILGSIPSVVYGLFGLTILAPFAQSILSLTVGQCALVAGITLGIMSIPITISITEDALSAVPKELSEAALALGSTKWETLTRVVLPAAKRGITSAVLLTFGRAIGETMVVLMLAGGAARITLNPTSPVRPMTATIAAEMGETPAGSTHFHALFAVGAVLFIITFAINYYANKYSERQR